MNLPQVYMYSGWGTHVLIVLLSKISLSLNLSVSLPLLSLFVSFTHSKVGTHPIFAFLWDS